MTTITIPAPYVGAILQFPALKSVKRCNNFVYLESVYLESTGDSAFMVATDGSILGAFRLEFPPASSFKAIIPRQAFLGVKFGHRADDVAVTITDTDATVSQGQFVKTEKLVPLDYPDWRRVIPHSVSGEAGYYDAGLVARIGRAAEVLHGKGRTWKAHIEQNGKESVALVGLNNPSFVGAIMPMIARPAVVPKWVNGSYN